MKQQIEPTPVSGHTPWRFEQFESAKYPGSVVTYRIVSGSESWRTVHVEKDTRGKSPVTAATFQQIVDEHNNAPRLARENAALREALTDLEAIASLVSGLMTLHGQVSPEKWYDLAIETQNARAALALSSPSQATSTPKPPSDEATGTPDTQKRACSVCDGARRIESGESTSIFETIWLPCPSCSNPATGTPEGKEGVL